MRENKDIWSELFEEYKTTRIKYQQDKGLNQEAVHKKTYSELMLKYHPDRNNNAESEEKAKALNLIHEKFNNAHDKSDLDALDPTAEMIL